MSEDAIQSRLHVILYAASLKKKKKKKGPRKVGW